MATSGAFAGGSPGRGFAPRGRAEYRLDCAASIIESQFGPIVASVFRVLAIQPCHVRRLYVLCKGTSHKNIRKAVTVLIQHGMLEYEEAEHPIFYAKIEDVLLRLHFPAYAHVIGTMYGTLAERIFEQLFLHGLMRLSRLMGTVVQLTGGQYSQTEILELFRTLVQDARVIQLHGAKDSELFTFPDECKNLDKLISQEDGATNNISADQHRYWTICHTQLLDKLQTRWGVTYIRAKISDEAAIIVEALAALRQSASPEEVATQLKRMGAKQLSREHIAEWLQVLISEGEEIVVQAGMYAYMYNHSAVATVSRTRAVEKTIEERYGIESMRIYNILCEKHYLEQDQLSKIAIAANFKATRLLINRLWKAGFVQIYEAARAQDRTTGRYMHLWTADPEAGRHLILDECIHIATNLIQRELKERQQHERILSQQEFLSQELSAEDAEYEEESVKADRKQLKKVLAGISKLHQQLLYVDRLMLQLRDYA
ncbi:uncharacterized protein MONBRDRAFT_35969 [Monosiga brevicollis MX1]|uniref:DNA-directed RNA polymerase III subunit RPC3 n=1 Tax=Monosiga brevicollis TaxID=81824 RepID=A9UR34_MONBE|nr:uncharacterized protein MONBRDRAFT_35969 [Monosiga brevicollis MX1]EDQ91849.1 predicted protein [Monosiga brevicollis MX1]|eukprot:XP_001743135.1 hypothetical protein [Monosiga brevicollis MX1]